MKQLVVVASCLLLLCACGGDSAQEAPIQEVLPPTEASPDKSGIISLLGKSGENTDNVTAVAGVQSTSVAVVNSAFTNASGTLRNAKGSAPIIGNLTFGVSAQDTDGLDKVSLYLPAYDREYVLCDSNCGDNYQKTITGFNPQLIGADSGTLTVQLAVGDLFGNMRVVDSQSIQWQPISIEQISAERTQESITISWTGNAAFERYNLYLATDPSLTIDNATTLPQGQQFLALVEHQIEIPDQAPEQSYYFIITGINDNGESGMAEPAELPSLIVPVNQAPVAVNDAYVLEEDTTLRANILVNDIDADEDELSVTRILADPAQGELSFSTNGDIVYQPNINFFGSDQFTYEITDGQGHYASAIVSLSITPVNDAPVANINNYTLNQENIIIVDAPGLLANDTDIDGDKLAVIIEPIVPPEFGQLQLASDGSFSYIGNEFFFDADRFVYQIIDEAGAIDQAEVILYSIAEAPAPIAVNDTYQTNEDTVLNIDDIALGILGNDSDPSGLIFTLLEQLIDEPNHGMLALALDGTFSYQPNPDFYGLDQFTYQITNSEGKTAQATVTISVIAQPDAPIVNNDSYTVDEDTLLVVDVAQGLLANDINPDNGELVVDLIRTESPSSGEFILEENGSFTYLPNSNFNGVDIFSYTATNGDESATAQVTITVIAVNDPPVAVDDTARTEMNSSIIIDVLGNDYDIDGQPIFIIQASTSNGAVTIFNDNLRYTPPADFLGATQIFYTIENGLGVQASARVDVSVFQSDLGNQAPVALDDSYTVDENTVLSGYNVLDNDSDADGDPLTVITAPLVNTSNGTLVLMDDGQFTYTPDVDYFGQDMFVYKVLDGNGGEAQATVTLTVLSAGLNDAPVAVDDNVSVEMNSTAIIEVLDNDYDKDGQRIFITQASATDGVVTIFNDNLSYTPPDGFLGATQIFYTIENNLGAQASATAYVSVYDSSSGNTAPVAQVDNYVLNEDEMLSGENVMINDSDADGDALTIATTPIIDVRNGELVLNSDGSFTYMPNADFFGNDSFTYLLIDGKGGESQGNVSLTINNVNDAPVAVDDNVSTLRNLNVVFDPIANDYDIENNAITLVSATADYGEARIEGSNINYTPETDFTGLAQIVYTIEDNHGASSNATVNISVTAPAIDNTPPVAVNDNYQVNEDSVLETENVLDNDSDADSDALFVLTTPISNVINGHVSLTSDGRFIYTPNPSFFGEDSFTYLVLDGNGGEDQATVTINVVSVNDAPIAIDDSYTLPENSIEFSGNVLTNDNDIEGDTLTVDTSPIATVNHGSLTLAQDGNFVYTPQANYFGNDSFIYQVSDGNGGYDQATVNLFIESTNSAPIAGNDNYAMLQNETLLADTVLANDSDVDNDPLTVNLTPVVNVSHGSLTLESDGTFVYEPTLNFSGTDSFVYQVQDPELDSAQATVTITITSTNSLPIAIDDNYTFINDDGKKFSDNVLDNDTDIDGDIIQVVNTPIVDVLHGSLILTPSGNFQYWPDEDFVGVDFFVYEITDGNGGSAQATVTLNVQED